MYSNACTCTCISQHTLICTYVSVCIMYLCIYLCITYLCYTCTFVQDTNAICTQLSLCNSTKTAKLPITPVLVKSPVAADGCDICKLVVSYVKPFVDSKSTKDEVQAALEQFCKILPANASEEVSHDLKQVHV